MMSDNEKRKKEDRLSIRTSVIVWLSGAVLGWVVAVLAVYTILRAPDSNISANKPGGAAIQEAQHTPAKNGDAAGLSAIEPAAGPTTAGAKKSNPLK
jgi:hypothetical protein